MTLERRTELRRDGAGARRFADQRSQLRRTGPPAPQSQKRRDERPERERVRALVIARDGYVCRGRALVPEVECAGDLDLDEIKQRGVNPGGHLDPDNCQLLCHLGHHPWKTVNAVEAVRRGLRLWSWQ